MILRFSGILLYGFLTIPLFAVEHPHLLFSKSELPELRQRIEKEEVPRAAMTNMKQRCESVIQSGKLPERGHEIFFDPLTELLLTWHLTQNKKYADAFQRLIREAIVRKFTFPWYYTSLIFDMGYDLLTQEERAYLKKQILKFEERIFPWEDCVGYCNITLCANGQIYLEALSLYGEPEYNQKLIEDCVARLQCFFRGYLTPEGIPIEGWTYYQYGMKNRAALLIEALRRKGYPVLEETYFHKIPQAILETVLPSQGLMIPPNGDARRTEIYVDTIRYLAHWLPEDPCVPFLLRAVAVPDKQSENDPASAILCYPKTKPASADAPLPAYVKNVRYIPFCQKIFYKSSFGPKALFFSASASNSTGHAHNDAGAFLFENDGLQWIIDPGYGKPDSGGHSSLLIDDVSEQNPQLARGVIRSTLIAPSGIFFDINMTPHWNLRQNRFLTPDASPVASARRAFVLSLEDSKEGIPFYMMLFDRVQKDQELHTYTQCFPFLKEMKVKASSSTIICTKPFQKSMKLILNCLSPENVKSKVESFSDYGRYPQDFKRGSFSATGKVVQFATMLYPYKNGVEPKIESLGKYNYQYRIDWPMASDYWVWNNPDDLYDNMTPSFAMFRCKNGSPEKMENIESYLIFDAENINVYMGGGKFLSRWEATAGRKQFYRNIGARINAAFRDGIFCAEVFTPVDHVKQISHRSEFEIYAPNTKEVWCNGNKCDFIQKGNFIVFTAWSSVPSRTEQEIQQRYQKLYDDYQKAFDKIYQEALK